MNFTINEEVKKAINKIRFRAKKILNGILRLLIIVFRFLTAQNLKDEIAGLQRKFFKTENLLNDQKSKVADLKKEIHSLQQVINKKSQTIQDMEKSLEIFFRRFLEYKEGAQSPSTRMQSTKIFLNFLDQTIELDDETRAKLKKLRLNNILKRHEQFQQKIKEIHERRENETDAELEG